MTALATPPAAHPWARQLAAWVPLILFETLAQAALKAAGESLVGIPLGWGFVHAALGQPWVLIGAIGYLGSFAAWMVILDRMPLSKGFPMSSLVTVGIVAASVFVFGEVLDGWRLAGILLIVAGLCVMGNEDG